MNRILSLFIFSIALIVNLSAQNSAIGVWKTIDDNTGEAKSYVEVFEEGGKLHGKVVKLLISPPDKICDKCTGDKKGKKLMGMRILEDLAPYQNYWKKGTIMDPETGKVYGCSIWLEEGKANELKVRGKHWSGLYRTQTWYKVEE